MAYTYDSLQDHVNGVLKRANVTALVIDWIYNLEQELNTVLHRREMTLRATTDTVADQASYALPSDFGDAMQLMATVDGQKGTLTPSNLARITERYGTETGSPLEWAQVANEFMLGPTPDGVYTLELYYYKTIANLATAGTNWLLVSYPNVYIYGTLAQAAMSRFADDPNAAKWLAAYENAKNILIRDQIRESSFGGGPLLATDHLPFGYCGRTSILTDR